MSRNPAFSACVALILGISMPINIDQELINELVKRQMAEAEEPAPLDLDLPQQSRQSASISPTMAAVLGAVADGSTTYRFLKRGTAAEDNAMWGRLNNSPAKTGLAAVGTGIGAAMLGKLLRNRLPKGVIDSVVANLGANQAGLAGFNVMPRRNTSQDAYNKAITRAIRRGP